MLLQAESKFGIDNGFMKIEQKLTSRFRFSIRSNRQKLQFVSVNDSN